MLWWSPYWCTYAHCTYCCLTLCWDHTASNFLKEKLWRQTYPFPHSITKIHWFCLNTHERQFPLDVTETLIEYVDHRKSVRQPLNIKPQNSRKHLRNLRELLWHGSGSRKAIYNYFGLDYWNTDRRNLSTFLCRYIYIAIYPYRLMIPTWIFGPMTIQLIPINFGSLKMDADDVFLLPGIKVFINWCCI